MKPESLIEDLRLVPVPAWWQTPWGISLLVALGFLLVSLVWRIAKRSRRATTPDQNPSAAPGESPHVIALRELEALRSRAEEMGHYQFTIECSRILREFLTAAYFLPSVYQTTREFLADAAAQKRISPEQQAELGSYLRACDRIKFARGEAQAKEMAAMLDYAVRFVKDSAQRPTVQSS